MISKSMSNCLKSPLFIRCVSDLAKSIENVNIENAKSKNVFRLKLKDEYATVDYTYDKGIYNLIHTNIPDSYKGQGLGKIIAQKTFQKIMDENKRAILTCEFLKKYYQENKHEIKADVVK